MPIVTLSPAPSEPTASELTSREVAWLSALRAHRYTCSWHRVGNVEWSTAIKVDGVRICLSYASALEAAAILGARLPTKAEADAMFHAARFVPPVLVRPVSASAEAIVAHSRACDAQATDCEMVTGHGKLWLAGAPAGRAWNYGFVDVPGSGAKLRANGLHMWQDVGAAHDRRHVDYSQTLRVVRDVAPATPPEKPPAPQPSEPTPTRPGDRGPAVTAWQRYLLAHGYKLPRYGADGDHGDETEAATQQWRDDHDEMPTKPDLIVPNLSAFRIVPASEWGAVKPRAESASLPARGILLHHMALGAKAGVTGANRQPAATPELEMALAVKLARNLQVSHMQGRGWVDTGQHFSVTKGGVVLEGRVGSLSNAERGRVIAGAHCAGKNHDHWGIEIEGDYTHSVDIMPAAQWNALVRLVAYLQARSQFGELPIVYHRKYAATGCPGKIVDRIPALIEAVRAQAGQ
jgi:hypothetical protein